MRSWEGIEGVVGAVSLGVDRGFNPTTTQPRFGGELAPIVGRSGHDRTAILSHDRESNKIAAVRSDQVGWAVPIASRVCRYAPRDAARSMRIQPSRCVAKVRESSGSIVVVRSRSPRDHVDALSSPVR